MATPLIQPYFCGPLVTELVPLYEEHDRIEHTGIRKVQTESMFLRNSCFATTIKTSDFTLC